MKKIKIVAKGKSSSGFKKDHTLKSTPQKSKGGRGGKHQPKPPMGSTGGVFYNWK